jgi:hypothetical protein
MYRDEETEERFAAITKQNRLIIRGALHKLKGKWRDPNIGMPKGAPIYSAWVESKSGFVSIERVIKNKWDAYVDISSALNIEKDITCFGRTPVEAAARVKRMAFAEIKRLRKELDSLEAKLKEDFGETPKRKK